MGIAFSRSYLSELPIIISPNKRVQVTNYVHITCSRTCTVHVKGLNHLNSGWQYIKHTFSIKYLHFWMLSTLILTKSDDPTEIPLIRSSSRFLKVPGLNVVELNYRIHLLCEIDIPVFQEKYILPVPHIRIICSEPSVTGFFHPQSAGTCTYICFYCLPSHSAIYTLFRKYILFPLAIFNFMPI